MERAVGMNEIENSERTIGKHKLTGEMNDLVDAILRGEDVVGEAFAGAGKSTLLRAVEKYHTNKKGLYICYNKSLEMEARTLFKGTHVDISTSHAYALNDLSQEARRSFLKKIKRKLTLDDLKEFTNIKQDDPEFNTLGLSKKWRLLLEIAENYISTASVNLDAMHIPNNVNSFVNDLVSKKKVKAKDKSALLDYLIKHSVELARAMLNPNSDCPATHDTYVKHWQLTEPVIDYDYIMFDEAQDANPVLLSVILKQKCQKIFVGDKHQSIYQFRGGVNAIDVIPHKKYRLSCSFRFGPQVASLATKVLNKSDDTIEVQGLGYDTEVFNGSSYFGDSPFLYLSQSNASLLEALLSCYQVNVKAKLGQGKDSQSYKKLESLLSFKKNNEPLLQGHKRYNSIEQLAVYEKDAETAFLLDIMDADLKKAELLLKALEWSCQQSEQDSHVVLYTAHGSKGLEHDTVMLADDFNSIVESFMNGKPLDEADLNLFYVAVTRARKTLIIPDELMLALNKNLAFTLKKTKPAKCLLDNLLPEDKPKANSSSSPKPASSTKTKTQDKAVNNEQKADDVPGESTPPLVSSESTKLAEDTVSRIRIEVGRSVEDDIPQYWMPTNTDVCLNPNLGIAGTMGTGKTQTVKSILTQLKRQEKLNTDGESLGILIFDYKSDYSETSFVNATGAKVLKLENLPINPLALNGKNRLALINTAKVFISTLSKVFNLGVNQEQTLKNCILSAYEKKNIDKRDLSTLNNTPPTLHDVITIYNSQTKVPQDSLTKALSDLYDYELFEPNARKCKNLYETLENNVVVVSLGDADRSLQNLVVAILLDSFYMQMHQSKKPDHKGSDRALKRMILVDEADNFMSQDFDSLKKILKEGREFGVGCLLSTQGLDHFKTKENSYSDYMTTWICHQLGNPKSKDLQQILNVKGKAELDKKMEEVRELKKHFSLYVDSTKKVTYQESTAFWKLDN